MEQSRGVYLANGLWLSEHVIPWRFLYRLAFYLHFAFTFTLFGQ
jgi:hypothetical protein